MSRRSQTQDSGQSSKRFGGSIHPDALYRLDEAAARMGWGAHALRAARRRGLKVHRAGKRGYIVGRDLLSHVVEGGTN